MSTDYLKYRKYELSILKHLTTLLPASIRVIDEEIDQELLLPTVALSMNIIRPFAFQHGSSELDDIKWTLAVFADTRTQRDFILINIFNFLRDNDRLPVYDYQNLMDYLTEDAAVLGYLHLQPGLFASPVTVPSEIAAKLRYRAVLKFSTFFN